MQQQLLKPQSKEHALRILQQGFQAYQQQGHMSFNDNHVPLQQSERMSFNEQDKKIKQHPKVHNIFESQKKIKSNENQNIINNRFEIPTLPSGRILKIYILSNWGDKQQVGLNGIEIFDSQGGNITRYVKMPIQDDQNEKIKLIDGYQAVQDDKHIWRTKNLNPEIIIDLTATIKISLLRIWNYNKSRIRAYKGAKIIKIQLDEKLIFYGQIQKATGDLKRFQENCEYILFTQDSKIINRIAELDWLNKRAIDYSIEILQQTMSLKQNRPNTGSKLQGNQQIQKYDNEQSPSSKLTSSRLQQQNIESLFKQIYSQRPSYKLEKNENQQIDYIQTIDLFLEFQNGSKNFLGLNSMLLIDNQNQQISFRDIAESNLTEYELDRLFYNRKPLSMDFSDLVWLKLKKIYLKFRKIVKLTSIKFYNFNQQISESSLTGPELVIIQFNGKYKTFHLRPAPCDQINFVQTIYLNQSNNISFNGNLQPNMDLCLYSNYIIAYPPCGMLMTIYLNNTWGDTNYVGLNGLEIYDHLGTPLLSTKQSYYTIHSVPELIDDPRVVKNLTILPHDITCPPQKSFLAPFINTPMEKLKNKKAIIIQKARDLEKQEINKIYILFDRLIQFSGIDFYNYTKDWQRGVKEIQIFVNNRLIYQGNINQTFQDLKKNIFNKTTILFSEQNLIKQKINPYFYHFPDDQVSLINENKQLVSRGYQQIFSQQIYRPQTGFK